MTLIRRTGLSRDPGDVFAALRDRGEIAFLDSSLENSLGKHSIIGVDPYRILEDRDGESLRDGVPTGNPFLEDLCDELGDGDTCDRGDLPLVSGAIGYLTYDFGMRFEEIQSRHPGNNGIPTALMVFYDTLIIVESGNHGITIASQGKVRPAEDSVLLYTGIMEKCPRYLPKVCSGHGPCTSEFSRAEYKDAVSEVIRHITEGDIYIMNMTERFSVGSEADPFEVYMRMRSDNPAPFGGFIRHGGSEILCCSPERLAEVRDGRITTRPIKGTRPRGSTPEEDEAYRNELIDSGKDRSELLMIVDLERNDLNRVCIPGSVEVTEHFMLEEYATVFHLVTEVVGTLEPGTDCRSLIEAIFPGGSITGAPKIRTMEIIDGLERSRRGMYTGTIGYFSKDGDCDLNIVIRTAVHTDGIYTIGAGGGITCESGPSAEHDEVLQKAKALFEAIGTEGLGGKVPGIFETVAVEDGIPILAEYHLERLFGGLDSLGTAYDAERLKDFFLESASESGEGRRVMRFSVSPEGTYVRYRDNPYDPSKKSDGCRIRWAHTERRRRSTDSLKTEDRELLDRELRSARSEGFLESLFVNEGGEVTEGTVTNVFAVKDGRILTPETGCGLLPGTVRRWVIENFDVTECRLSRTALEHADEVFLTNSLMGVMPVRNLEDRVFQMGLSLELSRKYDSCMGVHR